MTVRIRPMTPADVDPAADSVLRGAWGDRRSWFAFAVAHPACAPVVAVDGDAIVGTGVGTRYGASGWVGTIFVSPERRGEGLGLELSRVVADDLTAAGCRTLVLAATPAGRPVYERLGFAVTDTYVVVEHAGGPDRSAGPVAAGPERADGPARTDEPGSPEGGIRPFTADDLHEAIALDRSATGEDRAAVLGALAGSATGAAGGLALRGTDRALRAFLLRGPWPGGATIAVDVDAALAITSARVGAHPDGRVVTGLLASNAVGIERFAAASWTEIRRVARMERGDPLPWRPDRIFGQLNYALG
jgi:predicted N-acetyltransferase YhbS